MAGWRRVAPSRSRKRPSAAQSDGAILVVADHRPDVALLHLDIEMIEPEPGHLLAQLIGRIDVAQQRAGGGLAAEVGVGLLIGLGGGLSLGRVGERTGRLALRVDVDDQLGHRGGLNGKGVDLTFDRIGQAPVAVGMKLTVEPAPRPQPRQFGRPRASRPR